MSTDKFAEIKQPPLVSKFSFLVDACTENKGMGVAFDLDKVSYNLKLLGNEYNFTREINTALSVSGIVTVHRFGRYITVITISKDERRGQMIFFDFEKFDIKFLKELLIDNFPNLDETSWVKLQSIMYTDFEISKDDTVEILLL